MSLTPMLKQYQSVRTGLTPDTVLFFRLGDFYEMFFEDARRASSILDITLTARDGGNGKKVPMCGVPFHSAQGYVNRLTRSGLKVAICDQVEDPKTAKGLVRREVVRIISPATNLEDDTGEAGRFNYITAFYKTKRAFGCACLDLGTGDFRLGEYLNEKELEDEIIRLAPRECVISKKMGRGLLENFFREHRPAVSEYEDWVFDHSEAQKRILDQFQAASLASFGIEDLSAAVPCAGAVLYYLKDNLHKSLEHIRVPVVFQNKTLMFLDKQTIRNLELVQPASGDKHLPTLYSTLNKTATPMGARLLGQWITRPLVNPDRIRSRLDAVDALASAPETLSRLREPLFRIRDVERLLARINCGTPSARDIVSLGASLRSVPELKAAIGPLQAALIQQQHRSLFELQELTDTIDQAFVDLPPPGIRDGGFVRSGYSRELDDLRGISANAKEWLAQLQKSEIEKTGIKSLKIKFNKVFGYYIDVTKSNLPMVPDHYIRRQTLVNSERFIIPELKEYEEKILGAEERARELEFRIFEDIRVRVLKHISEIQNTANAVGALDVLSAFAAVARANNYCKPDVTDSTAMYIAGGRHPVVEQTLQNEPFVDNDATLDTQANQLLIITGPNMAGKSTFIRQVALITLMAQMGSFVPARAARMGIVDRVFSRIGASDNLARGESTFMVEMIETANILHNATSRSLLVFDEIGRGTSTFDGLSIAWSVCEFLNRDNFRPKCLFATHYHELAELADHRPGIRNYNVTVKELEDNILFLRKVIAGGADRSYGIHVGKLAGLPGEIIERAGEVLLCLEEEKISEDSISEILKRKKGTGTVYDLPLFKPLKPEGRARPSDPNSHQKALERSPVLREIEHLDINNLTPMEALMKVSEWRKALKNGGGGS